MKEQETVLQREPECHSGTTGGHVLQRLNCKQMRKTTLILSISVSSILLYQWGTHGNVTPKIRVAYFWYLRYCTDAPRQCYTQNQGGLLLVLALLY